MSDKHMIPERMQKLLADKTVQSLNSSEKMELQNMLQTIDAKAADRFAEELELVAATLDRCLSAATDQPDSIPEQIEDKVLTAMAAARKLQQLSDQRDDADATVHEFPALPVAVPVDKLTSGHAGSGWGWVAAAASFALALIFGWQLLLQQPSGVPMIDAASQREALLAQSDTMVIPWQPPDDQRFANVSGDVVWDNDSQTGYMRLVNMPVNDPSDRQYQLWIVDPKRDEHPVDGGVFDVSDSGEVIVPINSKLSIIEPAAFAITEEKPGGVVVSEGPLLVVASAEQSEQA